MNLTHVRLLVSHFAESFRFYHDGLALEPEWGDEGSTYASFRTPGGSSIALFRQELMSDVLGTRSLPSRAPAQDHVALILEVDDLQRAIAELHAKGIRFINDATEYPAWGIKAIHLRDPDGNLLELFSSLPKAQWTDRLARDSERYRLQYGASA